MPLALELGDEIQLQFIVQRLLLLLCEYPDYGPLYLYIGNIYSELKKPKKAIEMFKKVISIKPNYPLASLGLFHALWDLDQEEEALDEIERFISVADLNNKEAQDNLSDYQKIIQELITHEDFERYREKLMKLLFSIEARQNTVAQYFETSFYLSNPTSLILKEETTNCWFYKQKVNDDLKIETFYVTRPKSGERL